MLIPVFAITAQNMQQRTHVPGGIIAATGMLIMGIGATLFAVPLGTDPRKKATAGLSALLRGPAQGSTLLTPGTDA
jgi:hypothetical protein